MLTILAWMVFIPAVILNMVLLPIVFTDIVCNDSRYWAHWRNARDIALSLLIMFIPGVYLFGWF